MGFRENVEEIFELKIHQKRKEYEGIFEFKELNFPKIEGKIRYLKSYLDSKTSNENLVEKLENSISFISKLNNNLSNRSNAIFDNDTFFEIKFEIIGTEFRVNDIKHDISNFDIDACIISELDKIDSDKILKYFN